MKCSAININKTQTRKAANTQTKQVRAQHTESKFTSRTACKAEQDDQSQENQHSNTEAKLGNLQATRTPPTPLTTNPMQN